MLKKDLEKLVKKQQEQIENLQNIKEELNEQVKKLKADNAGLKIENEKCRKFATAIVSVFEDAGRVIHTGVDPRIYDLPKKFRHKE